MDIQQNAKCGENSIEFDLIGIDASLANAFRRILLSEVRYWLCSFSPTAASIRPVQGPDQQASGMKQVSHLQAHHYGISIAVTQP